MEKNPARMTARELVLVMRDRLLDKDYLLAHGPYANDSEVRKRIEHDLEYGGIDPIHLVALGIVSQVSPVIKGNPEDILWGFYNGISLDSKARYEEAVEEFNKLEEEAA